MGIIEIIETGATVVGCLITLLGVVWGMVKFFIHTKVHPLETKLKETDKEITEIDKSVAELKQLLIDEVKDISTGNYEFRIKYENSLNEIRVLLAQQYATKEEVEKELDEIKRRIERSIERGE